MLLSEDDWNAVQETLYLNAIPGMSASILAADAEDLDACRTYDPNEEANRTQSGALWRICRQKAGKKMRQDGGAEFISDSLKPPWR